MTIGEMRIKLIKMGLPVEEWSDDKIAADYPKFMLPWSEKVKALEIRCLPLHEMSMNPPLWYTNRDDYFHANSTWQLKYK
ncbi:MAG: hypothetical protein WBP08_18435 [Saprospiraceae bacterium]|jgi:hypothetical protein